MVESIAHITTPQRLEALAYFFGLESASVLQIMKLTGLSPRDLGSDHPFSLTGGFSAIRTCTPKFRTTTLAPNHQGDRPFWASAILGYWAIRQAPRPDPLRHKLELAAITITSVTLTPREAAQLLERLTPPRGDEFA